MNTSASEKGLKNRDVDDAFVDLMWKGFNGYKPKTEGIKYDELLYCLWQVAM